MFLVSAEASSLTSSVCTCRIRFPAATMVRSCLDWGLWVGLLEHKRIFGKLFSRNLKNKISVILCINFNCESGPKLKKSNGSVLL